MFPWCKENICGYCLPKQILHIDNGIAHIYFVLAKSESLATEYVPLGTLRMRAVDSLEQQTIRLWRILVIKRVSLFLPSLIFHPINRRSIQCPISCLLISKGLENVFDRTVRGPKAELQTRYEAIWENSLSPAGTGSTLSAYGAVVHDLCWHVMFISSEDWHIPRVDWFEINNITLCFKTPLPRVVSRL